MKTTTLALSALLGLAACGDDAVPTDFEGFHHDISVNLDATSISDAGGDADAGPPAFPAPPTLGTQIDRFGRPGVNTALTDPFWDDGTQTADQHHARQDAYNAASDPAAWATLSIDGATVLQRFEGALAAYDALDGNSDGAASGTTTTGCGNQLAFSTSGGYAPLAGVLADDRLYVNTSSGACTAYLAVEAAALASNAPTDCGGRTPGYDVIDITYAALVHGAFVTAGCDNGTASCTVGDGVAKDADSTPSSFTFPFLAGTQ